MIHCGKITKEQLLKIGKQTRREVDIEYNVQPVKHRVVELKKHKKEKHKNKLFNE